MGATHGLPQGTTDEAPWLDRLRDGAAYVTSHPVVRPLVIGQSLLLVPLTMVAPIEKHFDQTRCVQSTTSTEDRRSRSCRFSRMLVGMVIAFRGACVGGDRQWDRLGRKYPTRLSPSWLPLLVHPRRRRVGIYSLCPPQPVDYGAGDLDLDLSRL